VYHLPIATSPDLPDIPCDLHSALLSTAPERVAAGDPISCIHDLTNLILGVVELGPEPIDIRGSGRLLLGANATAVKAPR
jgi:hypothetical protein